MKHTAILLGLAAFGCVHTGASFPARGQLDRESWTLSLCEGGEQYRVAFSSTTAYYFSQLEAEAGSTDPSDEVVFSFNAFPISSPSSLLGGMTTLGVLGPMQLERGVCEPAARQGAAAAERSTAVPGQTAQSSLTLAGRLAQAPQVVERIRVVVLDPEFRVLRTIDSETALAEFTRLWEDRERVDSAPLDLSEYDVALDIAANHGSGRWFCRTDGLTTLLSVKSGNVYRVPDAGAFNALLHLEAKPRSSGQP